MCGLAEVLAEREAAGTWATILPGDLAQKHDSGGVFLVGPAELDDGSQNLMGALATCMGNVGKKNIREFQETEIIIAPAIKTEGKFFQALQQSC